jgi:hypothetical protein
MVIARNSPASSKQEGGVNQSQLLLLPIVKRAIV